MRLSSIPLSFLEEFDQTKSTIYKTLKESKSSKSFPNHKSIKKPVKLESEVKIYYQNGKKFDHGFATIKNISAQSALLDNLRFSQGLIPLEPISIRLRILEGELYDLELPARLVRLNANGQTSLELRFSSLSKKTKKQLKDFLC